MSDDDLSLRKGRRRDLLRDFYGSLDQTVDPLDSPHFDVSSYTSNVLKSEGVVELLNTDNSLVAGIFVIEHKVTRVDIRRLDSSMKTLVYENYNKFIHATETVRQVSTR
jgi:hypothetical protein